MRITSKILTIMTPLHTEIFLTSPYRFPTHCQLQAYVNNMLVSVIYNLQHLSDKHS